MTAFSDARFDENTGVIVLTGEGEKAFCSGGDQKVRGDYGGYKDDSGVHHLNVLDFNAIFVLVQTSCSNGGRLCNWW